MNYYLNIIVIFDAYYLHSQSQMFTIRMTTAPVFIMDMDNEDISNAREGVLMFEPFDQPTFPEENNDPAHTPPQRLNFIEKDGFYAYSEFFSEGNWPDKYFYNLIDEETGNPIIDPEDENSHLPEMYSGGLKLNMVSGGWCRTLSDLVQSIPHHEFNEILDVLEQSEAVGMEIEVVNDEW